MNIVRAAILATLLVGSSAIAAFGQTGFTPPDSPRATFNFDANWKFIRQDVEKADTTDFDDSKWDTVSTPHTFNDVDSYRTIIKHSGGDQGVYQGLAWYRKHFKIPAEYSDRKVFLEFEGMRQAGKIFLNGKQVGLYENGVTAYGVDLTAGVNFGDKENVLAVQVDNRLDYKEQATATPFEWNVNDFNPNYGGINRHVWLHITGKYYQTLPLYYGLETTGVYVYPSNISIADSSCDVTVESQVCNNTGDQGVASLSAIVVDDAGRVRATLVGDDLDLVDGEKDIMKATGTLEGARFWSPDEPFLYTVYTVLTVNKQVVDVCKIRTGFRKVEFRGGVGKGGVFINDKFVFLTGYAQSSSNEWAGLGQAYPDWMHDFTAQLIRDSNANFIRWMHVTPQLADVDACDRYGIVEVSPAGDREKDATGHQWDQRADVMRDSIVYLRNHPSILFWEAGNTVMTPEHMQQMVDIRKQFDPDVNRAMGTRGDSENPANIALTPISEYFGVMLGQDPQTDRLPAPKDMFHGYSGERRDKAPIIESEDFRDEAPRRVWDDFSPPELGFKPGAADTYDWNSESFCLADAARYWAYFSNRISNPDPNHSKWSGYASIFFSDSNADGRQDSSEVCRVSGKVDAVRLPKEIYYTQQVMQSPTPAIHILGHWTYPAGTEKTVCVISNCQAVDLLINGKSVGKNSQPVDGYIFAFPPIAPHKLPGGRFLDTAQSLPTRDDAESISTIIHFDPGSIKAIGFNDGKIAAECELKTVGPAKSISLSPILGPKGLLADGADVALVDVEVVDAKGNRCPTDEARIDFTISGPGIWRGGYNSGIVNSTNNLYLNTECGINRVAVRSTLTPGTITLTAKRDGLDPATLQIEAVPVTITDGLSTDAPERLIPPDSVQIAR